MRRPRPTLTEISWIRRRAGGLKSKETHAPSSWSRQSSWPSMKGSGCSCPMAAQLSLCGACRIAQATTHAWLAWTSLKACRTIWFRSDCWSDYNAAKHCTCFGLSTLSAFPLHLKLRHPKALWSILIQASLYCNKESTGFRNCRSHWVPDWNLVWYPAICSAIKCMSLRVRYCHRLRDTCLQGIQEGEKISHLIHVFFPAIPFMFRQFPWFHLPSLICGG